MSVSNSTKKIELIQEKDVDTKLSLMMKSLTEFYKNTVYIEQMKNIVDQNSVISLRILDWFITNYAKKYRTIIQNNSKNVDVYQNYKLQLKSYSKRGFDPFCRKNKIRFYYTDDTYIETSCGQLCFFRWCFENDILSYVKNNLSTIEQDMKSSLKKKKLLQNNDNKSYNNSENNDNKSDNSQPSSEHKRQPLSISAARSVSKQNVSYTIKFD
jgi:hypothetical protein